MVELILVRHGESAGNVAAAEAVAANEDVIDAPMRDADVPLSDAGTDQARALGDGLRELPDPTSCGARRTYAPWRRPGWRSREPASTCRYASTNACATASWACWTC